MRSVFEEVELFESSELDTMSELDNKKSRKSSSPSINIQSISFLSFFTEDDVLNSLWRTFDVFFEFKMIAFFSQIYPPCAIDF